jgi:hypothetical protein
MIEVDEVIQHIKKRLSRAVGRWPSGIAFWSDERAASECTGNNSHRKITMYGL